MKFRQVIILIMSLFIVNESFPNQEIKAGAIQGLVIDSETKTPLPGTNIIVTGTPYGAAADLSGQFVIHNIPVGNYVLQFDFIGYSSVQKPDVIVRSQRSTTVKAELKIAAIEIDALQVTGGFFSRVSDQPTSAVNFSNEEIRRAPGSAGDVSRILMSLPGIAKVNDQTNNLIVRGGSPIENAFYIDNIEIPNINHFPTQASSGGPLGLLNVDFIQDVTFYMGGFSAIYGDRLSSVMDITFREGNRNEFDGQLDLNFAGFGGVFEGPLPHSKGSWLFSARRSYLDLVVDVFNVGSTIAPTYGDYQGKVVYDLNSSHKLMLLAVWGDDHNNPDRETGLKNDMVYYGNQDICERTTGMNWRALWGKSGYSNTSISHTGSKFNENFYETNTGDMLLKNRSYEQTFKFRNVNHFRLNTTHSFEFGIEAKYLHHRYDNLYGTNTNVSGNMVSSMQIDKLLTAEKFAAFLNYIFKPFNRFTTNIGIHSHYFSYNNNSSISPRFSFSYNLSTLTTVNGSFGLFYQNLPLLLLAQRNEFKNLRNPCAMHFVLGLTHLITENTKLTLEIYQKKYHHFPVDPDLPGLFLIDEIYYDYGFFTNHHKLTDSGQALSRGIEIMIQKKLAQNFYGLASAAYFRSQYKGGDNTWRNRSFDNKLLFSIEGGYKPNHRYEFSLRWIYAGGAPYTPFDSAASKLKHRAVFDETQINKARYPEYHSMNLRLDRRFHFSQSNLIVYFSVWNVYDRKNIATYFWNDSEGKQDQIYQWRLLPIFGLEYEF